MDSVITNSPTHPLSFFGEPKLKEAVRTRVAEHRRQDEIAQGRYWSMAFNKERGVHHTGCLIGCSLHSARHSDFRFLLGLPVWLAFVSELIFERMSLEDALDFPLALYDAIPVGADLTPAEEALWCWLRSRYVRITDPALSAAWARSREEDPYRATKGALAVVLYMNRDTEFVQNLAREAGAALIEALKACKPVETAQPALPSDPYFTSYYSEVLAEVAK
jgi:hypothetical protein